MSTQLYAVQEVSAHVYIRQVDPHEAAALFQRSGHVLLGTFEDMEAFASSRGKLLYTPSIHAEDAPLGRPRIRVGSSAA
jgi:hypothetical protein